jgi:Putative prokaryotic signal transducing protein
MRKVYTAANPIQAHVLRGALEAAGIDAVVRGEYLFNARGEAPVTIETLPSVWILRDEDLADAEPIVRALDAPVTGPIDTWRCRCGELVEGQFDTCWSCGQRR